MRCYKCKTELKDNMQFCPDCGAPQQFTEELINKAAHKERAAVEQLFHMTKEQVYFVIRTMVWDEDEAFDLMQESYTLAFKTISRLKNPAAFRRWIKRLSCKHAAEYLKKKKYDMFEALVSVRAAESDAFADERNCVLPLVNRNAEEVESLLRDLFSVLSGEQQLLAGMFYGQKMSLADVADILEVSESVIKGNLVCAGKAIRSKVSDLEAEGVKDDDLSAIAYLMWLYQSLEACSAEFSAEAILHGIVKKSTVAKVAADAAKAAGTAAVEKAGESIGEAAGQMMTEAAGKIAGDVGKSATKAVVTKVVAGVTATAVIGGGAAGVVAHNNENKAELKKTVVLEQPAEHYIEDFAEIDAETLDEITLLVEQSFQEKFGNAVRVDLKDGENDFSFSPDVISDTDTAIGLEGYFAYKIGSGGYESNILFVPCYVTMENVQFFEPDGEAYFVTYEDTIGVFKVTNIMMQEDGTISYSDDYVDFVGFYTTEELLYEEWIAPLENNYRITRVGLDK